MSESRPNTFGPDVVEQMTLRPPHDHIRVVVDRADAPRCGIQVGDWFEVRATRLSTPGKPFCANAIAAVVPVLGAAQGPMPVGDWLERKPWICCPDASENVVMRLERVVEP